MAISNKRRFAEYEALLASVPPQSMSKRPKYINGIGLFRGKSGDTVFIKIRMPRGGVIKGKTYPAGASAELKLGNLSSFSWQELERIQQEYQGKADRGELTGEIRIPTFQEYAVKWLENAKTRMAKRGYTNTKGVIYSNLIPFFKNTLMNKITVSQINEWQSQTLQSVKPSTLKRRQVVLNSILNTAVREDLIESNSVERVNRIRIAEPRRRYLKQEELRLFLQKATAVRDWLKDYILWGIHSGMRQGETRRMKWTDIHYPDGGTPFIVIRTGKTNQIRHVSCSDEMLAILSRQKGREVKDISRPFPYAEATIRRAWDSIRKLTGVNDVTVQNLRTTSATYGAMAGIPLRTLAGRLGHKDMKMLETHYAAVVGSDESKASKAVEKAIISLIYDQ